MIRRLMVSMGFIAAFAVLTTACTDKTPDSENSPPPNDPSSVMSSAGSALPFAGAPKVSNPLPATVLAGDPCADSLTAEQVQTAIGISAQGKREDLAQTGPACGWTNRETGGSIGVSYTVNTHVGLSGVYANTQPQSAVWLVLPDIQGFPAVAYSGTKPGGPSEGFCQASIGIADDFSIDVSLALGSSKSGTVDACSLISQIGDMTITTLKAKAGY